MVNVKKEAIYITIKNDIKQKINSGIFKPGSYLPTEKELSENYNASRGTIRKVIDVLEKEGTVSKKASVGAYISYPKIKKGLSKLTGFTQDILNRGGKPSSKIVYIKKDFPPEDIKKNLNITNEKVYIVSRIRYDNNQPIAREIAYYPIKFFSDFEKFNLAKLSIYDLIENEYHLSISYAVQTIEPAKAEKDDVVLLGTNTNDLTLHCIRTTYLENSVPIECTETWYRSDRYIFTVTLTK